MLVLSERLRERLDDGHERHGYVVKFCRVMHGNEVHDQLKYVFQQHHARVRRNRH